MRSTDSKWMERSSREVTNQLFAMNYGQTVKEVFDGLEKERQDREKERQSEERVMAPYNLLLTHKPPPFN